MCTHPTIRKLAGGDCPICEADERLGVELQYASDLQLAKLKERALAAAEARLSFAEFVKQAWHVLEPVALEWNWHLDALCANIQGMLDEFKRAHKDPTRYVMRWKRFIQNLCPGTLKSRFLMVFAPAWMWIDCPWWQVLCSSSNPENVRRDAEAHRDLVRSKWYRSQFGVSWTTYDVLDEDEVTREAEGSPEGGNIRQDIDSKSKFANTAGGMRTSRGLNSKVVGIHVHAIFLDDPDDLEDVKSPAERENRDGRLRALGNRLIDQRAFVFFILQQRVHVADTTGMLLAEGGWHHCNYPLFYEAKLRKDSPFYIDPRNCEGENLHPARFTPEVVEGEKKRLKLNYQAQYQGDPQPEGGVMFNPEHFGTFDIVIEDDSQLAPIPKHGEFVTLLRTGRFDLDWLVISCDGTLGSTTESASEVGLMLIGGKGFRRYIFDDETAILSYPAAKEAMRQLYRKYPDISAILIEDKATGKAMKQELTDLPNVVLIPVSGTKPQRAKVMQPSVEAGEWFIRRGMLSREALLLQVGTFPASTRSDRVDVMSQTHGHYLVQEGNTDALEARLAAYRGMPQGVQFHQAYR